jgi:16S rRNA (guanine527-N7)-methyltransferase
LTETSLDAGLRQGVTALGLDLSEGQIRQLLDYLTLLQKWNRVYNLTAVRDPQQMLVQHLLDSLSMIQPLRRELLLRKEDTSTRLLDVGSGGGLPGVVIAICCPETRVTCVDAVAKKAAFVRQVAAILALVNLHAEHARVESLGGTFDVVCSRAFASLADFVQWTSGVLGEGGCWLAMKGQHPDAEMAALPPTVHVFHVEQLIVPGLDARRCIVWMEPQSIRRD